MFRTRATGAEVDDVLSDLPEGFHAVTMDDATVVVGPTGAFVMGGGGRDARAVAARLARRAAACRTILSRNLSWAPFVETLVVSDRAQTQMRTATVVPARMLLDTLTAGPALLTADAAARVAEVLAGAAGPADSRSSFAG
jgi:hypothetical protein